MKTVVLEDKVLQVKNLELPKINKNEVLVKMRACGICGSDLEKVFGSYGMKSMRVGHEPAGIIIKKGENIKNFKVGDRVFMHHHVPCHNCDYCNNQDFTMCDKYQSSNIFPCGLSEFIVIPEWNILMGGLIKLPNNITFDHASLIEPVACCMRALNKISIKVGDKVLIFGAGPTGLMHMMLLRHLGVSKIVLLDINEFRLNYAKNIDKSIEIINLSGLSDDQVEAKVKSKTKYEKGADISIISTSNIKAFIQSLITTRKSGTISLFGVPPKESDFKIDLNIIYSKELKIIPSYATSEKEINQVISLMENNVIDFSTLITHRFDITNSSEAFNCAHQAKDAMKIIITNHKE